MLKEYLSTLANAFRSKLGITDKINAQNFPDKVNEVYDKGKYDEWSEVWDSIQQNGARKNYNYMFRSQSWNDTSFKPKYDIKPSSCNAMFARAAINDLESCLAKGGINGEGVALDLSNSTDVAELFGTSDITVAPELNFSKSNPASVFYNCTKLHTVRKFIINKSRAYSYTFYYCTALTNIKFEGEIGKTISFQYSPLNTASIVSIVECLASDVTGQTLTLKQTAVNAMSFPFTSEQSGITYNSWDELIANKTNWTFSLV